LQSQPGLERWTPTARPHVRGQDEVVVETRDCNLLPRPRWCSIECLAQLAVKLCCESRVCEVKCQTDRRFERVLAGQVDEFLRKEPCRVEASMRLERSDGRCKKRKQRLWVACWARERKRSLVVRESTLEIPSTFPDPGAV